MLTITATGRYSKCVSNEVITAGSVGIPAVFNLNEDFDGLSPIAVFRGSGFSFDVALIGSEVIVPHEVLANVGGILEVGVYARNGEGTIVIPTVWSVAGTIREGAIASGVDPSEPTPDWTAQVQAAASEAVQTANEAKDIAENAKEVAITSADSAQKSAVSANNSATRSSAAANAAERARNSAEQYRDDTLTYSVMADESANSARTYAQNAETSARDASNSADVVTQKAAAASEAATNAARSEENAFNSAREATDASDGAEQAAEQASLSAGRANESSQNAAESARLAALSEAAASTSALTANEAKIASEAAQSKAEAAKTAAETAKNRSEELYDYVAEANRSATEAAALAVAAKTDAETAAESATESAAIVQEVADRLPTIEENLDIAINTANDARITLFDGTSLVDYAVRDLNYTGTPGAADSTCLGVKRRGSRIVLNGGNISNVSRPVAFVKLTGNTTGRTNNSSTVRTWSDGITLKNGRTYRVTVIYISGETTSENASPVVSVSVYNLGDSSTIGYGIRDENNRYIRYFKAMGELNLCLFVPCYQVTYTDYTVDVILEEVDETVGEYLPSMVTNRALAVNEFVIVDNELFSITAPVASGGSLIPGTNCIKTTLSGQIETLNDTVDGLSDDVNALEGDVTAAQSMIATVEADSTASKEYAIGDLLVFEGKLYHAVSAISLGDTLIPDGNIELTTVEQQLASSGGGAVDDVQINGTSVLNSGVANVPMANSTILGVVAINDSYGININPSTGALRIQQASSSEIRNGATNYKPITTIRQHESAFYGLAKAAGDSTQSASSNAVGSYTDAAKSAIQSMLNVPDKSDVLEKFSDLQNDVNSKATAIYETVGPTSVVSFTDGANNAPIELLTADLCDQNLHGYDHPWAAGHGINMLPPVCNNSGFTLDENGAYSQNNTSSAGWPWTYSRNVVNATVQPGTYTVSFHAVTVADGSGAELRVFTSTGSQLKTISGSNKQSGSATFTVDAETTIGVCIKCYKGVWKLQLEEGSTASDWAPYENVCPMTGNTSIDISVSGADTTTPTVTHIAFVDPETEDPITVHGGTLTIDSDGTRHIDICQYYESYNGETLVGPWRSSDDAYDSEATPTVGAQVVDYGSVIKSFSLAGNPIYTLYGENNIWSNAHGNIIVRYLADSELYIEEAMKVKDVQINGTSVVSEGVASVPIGGSTPYGGILGVCQSGNGVRIANDGSLSVQPADTAACRIGTSWIYPIAPNTAHAAAFFGLAKAAGDTTQSQAGNTVGTYTESAKSAIHEMLNGPVEVTGTTPTIAAKSGISYKCGEVATLDITLPASGCIDVIFESGSTPTVLTVTPPTGVTVRWANGFDPTNIAQNTTYEINILDGLGVACTWI